MRTLTAFRIIVIGGPLVQAYNLWRYQVVRHRCRSARVKTESPTETGDYPPVPEWHPLWENKKQGHPLQFPLQ
jgi:hypothetical protein